MFKFESFLKINRYNQFNIEISPRLKTAPVNKAPIFSNPYTSSFSLIRIKIEACQAAKAVKTAVAKTKAKNFWSLFRKKNKAKNKQSNTG